MFYSLMNSDQHLLQLWWKIFWLTFLSQRVYFVMTTVTHPANDCLNRGWHIKNFHLIHAILSPSSSSSPWHFSQLHHIVPISIPIALSPTQLHYCHHHLTILIHPHSHWHFSFVIIPIINENSRFHGFKSPASRQAKFITPLYQTTINLLVFVRHHLLSVVGWQHVHWSLVSSLSNDWYQQPRSAPSRPIMTNHGSASMNLWHNQFPTNFVYNRHLLPEKCDSV